MCPGHNFCEYARSENDRLTALDLQQFGRGSIAHADFQKACAAVGAENFTGIRFSEKGM
jgi:hypothetical protein